MQDEFYFDQPQEFQPQDFSSQLDEELRVSEAYGRTSQFFSEGEIDYSGLPLDEHGPPGKPSVKVDSTPAVSTTTHSNADTHIPDNSSSVHRLIEPMVADCKPQFPQVCRPFVRPIEDTMGTEAEPAPSRSLELLAAALNLFSRKLSRMFDIFCEKRRNHQKFKDEPSMLTGFVLSTDFDKRDISQMTLLELVSMAFTYARDHMFECPDFNDISTTSLRHTCMGCLADGYKLYIKFVADILQFIYETFGWHCSLEVREKLNFLSSIESRPSLSGVCEYSVTSKASSAAKSAVREMYLELLALKNNTTPTLAQELVPGFTYDHIQSLDEVVELVQNQPTDTQSVDREIERFRQRLLNARPLGARVRPRISEDFIERLHKMMKSR